MATLTVTSVVTQIITSASSTATSSNRAASQGGIFEGRIPTHFEAKNPITLFIIQAALVVTLTRLLHWPLSKLRQPRVIAEVITGIILGPSIMGRIPGFTQNIFPTESMPPFALVANLGLVLFLFLVGLEVDLRYLASNWRVALSVGAAGMALPFGLGFAIAWGLYHQFHDEPNIVPISFPLFALFIGIAIAITAFPVLCRILTSLRLLSTPVGVIVLSAGVANDVVGWILLALCVALVNSGGGLAALWIFMVAVGYSLMVAYPVRLGFLWVLRTSGSLSNGPTQAVVALTLFMVLASAFFTDIIGIHAIFGAFMIGLICPHEGGFAIKITEKIEDLVSTLFLPLFFALSGLSTNLGLLDTGITWAYVIGVICVAFFGKVIGGAGAARLNGLLWGESITIGLMMSCKGLVELIVLNIGLQARILSERTFTIFVVMALVTTFATTPLTMWSYPPEYQRKVELWKKGRIDWNGNPIAPSESGDLEPTEIKTDIANRMLVYLRLDGLPSLFNVVSLFTAGQKHVPRNGSISTESNSGHSQQEKSAAQQQFVIPSQSATEFERPLRIHGLRLMELTERNSSVMRVSEQQEYAARDPVIKAFGVSAAAQRSSRNVAVSAQISVVPEDAFISTLVSRARDMRSDFILVPWSETGTISEHAPVSDLESTNQPFQNRQYANLATSLFESAAKISSVGVFIDKSLVSRTSTIRTGAAMDSPTVERSKPLLTRSVTGLSFRDDHDNAVMFRSSDSRGRHQIRALYRGHVDDLFAVRLALQLAKNEEAEIRIIRLVTTSTDGEVSELDRDLEKLRTSVPTHIASRVHWTDLTAPSFQTLASDILINKANEMGDTTIIIGRTAGGSRSLNSSQILEPSKSGAGASVTQNGHHQSGTSNGLHNELTRSLGDTTVDLVEQMKELNVYVSLLVVQAQMGKYGGGVGTTSGTEELKRTASVDSRVSI